jgi:hypothetical protein
MTEKGSFSPITELRFLVARFAMWFCGCPVLFWTAPAEWEEYMSIGEPYTEQEDA